MKLVDLFNANFATQQSSSGSASTPTVDRTSSGVTNTANQVLDWIGRGADIYADWKAADSVVPPNTPSGTTPGTATTSANWNKEKWMPYIIIAAVLGVVAYLVFRR